MAISCDCFRKEFQLKKLGLSGTNEEKFHFFHWRLPPFLYLLYRFCFAVYLCYWLIHIMCKVHHQYPWATWLTHWTYLILASYFVLSFISTLSYHLCCNQNYSIFTSLSHEEHLQIMLDSQAEYELLPLTGGSRMKIRISTKFIWVLFNISSSMSIIVTIMFFSFIFKGNLNQTDLQQHLLNSVIISIDQLITGIPVRIFHVIYPLIYCFIYVIFSVCYWSSDHHNVLYPGVLDWNKPGHTVAMLFVCALGIFILHLLLFFWYRFKQFVLKFS